MIISAQLECQWCGEKMVIQDKKTTRSFNIAFNKFKRIHDWNCESKGKADERVAAAKKKAKSVIDDALTRLLK